VLYIADDGVQNSGEPAQQQSQKQRFGPAVFIAQETAKADFSKGEMCFNHPWRAAYARCSYCNRPFCYADLTEHGGQQYCLEDLGHATEGPLKIAFTPNRFTYFASILFLLTSIMLFYYMYPQLQSIYSQILNHGLLSFLNQITYSSWIVLISSVFMIFGVVSSISVLSNSGVRFFGSVLMLISMLFFFSYQYLSTTSTGSPDYFLYLSLIIFLNLLMLVLSRSAYVGRTSEKSFYQAVEWPKVETF
jgi:hypothetical protein